jgi:uncharacterized protein YjiK
MLLLTAGACALAWALPAVFTPAAAPERSVGPSLDAPDRRRSPVAGPSGIACDPSGERLFVVGDRGHVAELDGNGRERSRRRVRGDLEDVALLPDGRLLILDESADEIFLYDYDRDRKERRWRLDVAGLLGTPRAPLVDDGFEGLAYVPGGSGRVPGLLYLGHQHRPARVVVASFDPAAPDGRLGAESVQARWNLETYRDAKAVAYVPSLDRFLVVSDGRTVSSSCDATAR